MKLSALLTILFLIVLSFSVNAQYTVSGKITDAVNGKAVANATVCIKSLNQCTSTDIKGNYKLQTIKPGTYHIIVSFLGYTGVQNNITVTDKVSVLNIKIAPQIGQLDSVNVRSARQTFGFTRLKDVDGSGIYAGKKSEVIVLKDITANTATNNSRQIYSKIAGLNIFESDGGAGLQLSIGGRGLDPNRTSNFNTRQNGYDISADALGYPESYYTPPAEAVERIEVVRGASSLQYGTQFGGIINFKMNDGVDTEKAQITSRLTGGSWGFVNTSTSVGGTVSKLKYYAFYQHKQGDGWRPYSGFNDNTVYLSATYKVSNKLSVTAQYTGMAYLEQQPGGLSDAMFDTLARQSTKTRNWFKVNWNLMAVMADYNITKNLKFNTRFFGLVADRSALGIINTTIDFPTDQPRQYRTDTYNNWGNESRFIYTYNTNKANPFTVLVGARYYHGYTDRQIGYGNNGSGGAKSDFAFDMSTPYDSLSYSRYKFPNHNIALFAENIFRVNSKLSIIPGLRYEDIVTEANGFYNIVYSNQSKDTVYSYVPYSQNKVSKRSFLIGGIGISYNQSNTIQFYANISQNYRAINFNDMSIVDAAYLVDSNLRDESGYSADMGMRGRIGEILNYDVSLFTIHYNDRIGIEQSPSTGKLLTTNVAQSRNIGIESFAELDIWKWIKGDAAKMKLSVFSNLSALDARYVNSQNSAVENKKVEYVPPVIFKAGITLQKDKFRATCQYSYTAQQFSDATNAVAPGDQGVWGIVPSYYVMDLSADYKLSRLFLLSATLNNLTNNMYFTRRADSYPGPGIIPADARSIYVTLQVKL
jgi:Fe(3+) dicitrate transport protein